MTDESPVHLTLRRAEALVLFEWLARFNATRSAAFEDQAEERVLWDLEASLESMLAEPFGKDYDGALRRARDEIRDRG